MNINKQIHLNHTEGRDMLVRLETMRHLAQSEQWDMEAFPAKLRTYNERRKLKRYLRKIGGSSCHGTDFMITQDGGSYTLNIE